MRTTSRTVRLGRSMYFVGLAIGAYVTAPLSDIVGRKWIYLASTVVWVAFNAGAGAAIKFSVVVAMMALSGVGGGAAVVNVAGSIADIHTPGAAGTMQALAFFIAALATGDGLGRVIAAIWSTYMDGLGGKWVFWENCIIGGAFVVLVLWYIPETLPRIATTQRPRRLDLSAADQASYTFTAVPRLWCTEPFLVAAALTNAAVVAMLVLYSEQLYDVLVQGYNLKVNVDPYYAHLNAAVGALITCALVPLQNLWQRADDRRRAHRPGKTGGEGGRSEARLLVPLITVWAMPASLYWFTFFTDYDAGSGFWSPVGARPALVLGDFHNHGPAGGSRRRLPARRQRSGGSLLHTVARRGGRLQPRGHHHREKVHHTQRIPTHRMRQLGRRRTALRRLLCGPRAAQVFQARTQVAPSLTARYSYS